MDSLSIAEISHTSTFLTSSFYQVSEYFPIMIIFSDDERLSECLCVQGPRVPCARLRRVLHQREAGGEDPPRQLL